MIAAQPHRASPAPPPGLGALRDSGYCVLADLMPRSVVASLARDLAPHFERTERSIGPFYGSGTKRFHGLLSRSPLMADFVQHPDIIAIAQSILGAHCDAIQLNLTQAIEILPGGDAQPPHRDQDMWPIRTAGVEYLINVMWPFTPYMRANGATLVWPGSHERQHDIMIDPLEAVPVEMDPGEALVFLGSTLHAGGANRTRASRRGMIVSYSLGWLKPYELPWLAYPPAVARSFAPELAALAGYRAHRPNLGTHEGRCPSHLLSDDTRSPPRAIDALLPEQMALIAAYRAGSLGPSADGVGA